MKLWVNYDALFVPELLFGKVILRFELKVFTKFTLSYSTHTNRVCVVQENVKPDVLKLQTELAWSVH